MSFNILSSSTQVGVSDRLGVTMPLDDIDIIELRPCSENPDNLMLKARLEFASSFERLSILVKERMGHDRFTVSRQLGLIWFSNGPERVLIFHKGRNIIVSNIVEKVHGIETVKAISAIDRGDSP